MNWSDYAVIGIILLFAAIGLMNGFILSVFRIASFFVSIIASIKFYPVVADFLLGTEIYTNIKQSIFNGLQKQLPDMASQEAAAGSVIDNLNLPEMMKGFIVEKIPDMSAMVDIKRILDIISGELAKMAIDVISLIALYLLIRIGLFFLKFIFQGIAKLPLFKQLDKLGGLALGALEGLLTVYILCAILMLFNAAPQSQPVFEAIDSSIFARHFYENNFIIDWAIPKDRFI